VIDPYYQDDAVSIFHSDFRSVLPSLSGDAVVVDPPYNVGKRYGKHDDAMGDEEYRRWMVTLLRMSADASADPVVFFPGAMNVWWSAEAVQEAGLQPVRLLAWHKKEFAGDKWTGGPAMCWEPIVWASKGERRFERIFGTLGRDMLVVPSTHGDPYNGPHPCPKSVRVMAWLAGLFCPPSGLIIDPCAGSGATLLAAKETGRRAIGIEIEERYCEIAAERCRQGVLAL
jgi:site-specific DNA-methyltransferase (adenine-specific)